MRMAATASGTVGLAVAAGLDGDGPMQFGKALLHSPFGDAVFQRVTRHVGKRAR